MSLLKSDAIKVLLLLLLGVVVDGLYTVSIHGWAWSEVKEHVFLAGLVAALAYIRRAIGLPTQTAEGNKPTGGTK